MKTGLLGRTALALGVLAIGAEVRIVKNGWIAETAPLGIRYENLEEPRLQELSKRENLPRRAGSGPRQFDQIVNIRDWVSDQWRPGKVNAALPWVAQTTLDQIRAGKTGGDSQQYAVVLLQSLTALGHTARYVELGSKEHPYIHFVVEVWSNDFNKWIVMDAEYNSHFERHGVPLSALEVHDAFVTMRLGEVFIKRSELSRGHPDPYLNPTGTAEFYYYLRYPLKADHLSQPDGDAFDRMNDAVEWQDKRVVPWELGLERAEIPRAPLTARKTADRAAIDAPINQVVVTAAVDEAGVVLTLRQNVRNFRSFEYRVVTSQGPGEWRRHTDQTLRIPHAQIARQIEIRGVNIRGLAGPASIVAID
jgi:hypothetical protein